MLLLSQIRNYQNYIAIKNKLIQFFSNFVSIFGANQFNLLRAITFDDIKKLIIFLQRYKISLDVRTSALPNLSKALQITSNKNSYNFDNYYSIPLNIKCYNILKQMELI